MRSLGAAVAVLIVLVSSSASTSAMDHSSFGRMSISFVENKGQVNQRAKFVIRGPNGSCFFTRDSIVYSLSEANGRAEALWVKLVDADPQVRLEGRGKLPGKVNYLIGRDESKWKRDISTYSGVVYRGAWEGIDVIYRGEGERLKYDIRVSAGADIGRVQLEYQGAKKLSLASNGDLFIDTPVASFTEAKPKVYQEIDGKKVWIEGSYTLSGSTVGFSVEGYNPAYQVVIDPASDLSWSTFLGGGNQDSASDVAVDASGSIYAAGTTRSEDFPTTPGAYDTTGSPDDAFVVKLNPAGNLLIYATFVGGTTYSSGMIDLDGGADAGQAVAVDAAYCAYLTGETSATDFPTTPGAFDTTYGWNKAFVTKLNAYGNGLVYSTFLAGAKCFDIAADSAGCAYVTGSASSILPTTSSALQAASAGDDDAFVTKLNDSGTALAYSTFLGGASYDCAMGIALGADGSAYVTGKTYSSDFPATWSASAQVAGSAFVSKLDPQGAALSYSTVFGGSGDDTGNSIAVDAGGSAYVAGDTDSPDFPTTAGAFCGTYHGNTDGFAARLSASGDGLLFSTLLGGGSEDSVEGIAVDVFGGVYVVGATQSKDFPVVPGAFGDSFVGGRSDAYLLKLNPSGSKVSYATFLGSAKEDGASAVAVGYDGGVYVAGQTWSRDFPSAAGTANGTLPAEEAFVCKLVTPPGILKIGCSPADAGTTNPTAGAYVLAPGSGLAVSTAAAKGFVFSHWTGGVDSPTQPSTYVQVDGSKDVTAVYVPSLVEADCWPDGMPFDGTGCIVTATFPGFFYIETDDRTTGLRVEKASYGLSVGWRANVSGAMATTPDGERCVAATTAMNAGAGTALDPLTLSNRSLGGGKSPEGPSPGQPGITGAAGLNNIGLLVRIYGKVAQASTDGFVIDDGSNVFPEILVPAGLTLPEVNDYVVVTGISSCRKANMGVRRLLRVRRQNDILVLMHGTTIGGRVTQSGMRSVSQVIQPPSSYPYNYVGAWTIAGPPGAKRYRVHFASYSMLHGYAFLKDDAGATKQIFTGYAPPDLWSNWIDTAVLKLEYHAISSVVSTPEFVVDSYEVELVDSPVEGVTLTLEPGPFTSGTGPDGRYAFGDLTPDTYTVTPALTGYTFSPASQTVTVGDGQYRLNTDFVRN